MSRKHKTIPKPSVKTARDSRRAVHVYHPADDSHRQAYPAGRCSKCNKITNCFCDKCRSWTCGNHLHKKGDFEFCGNCID
jgi:hypothetical protein